MGIMLISYMVTLKNQNSRGFIVISTTRRVHSETIMLLHDSWCNIKHRGDKDESNCLSLISVTARKIYYSMYRRVKKKRIWALIFVPKCLVVFICFLLHELKMNNVSPLNPTLMYMIWTRHAENEPLVLTTPGTKPRGIKEATWTIWQDHKPKGPYLPEREKKREK